jgi:hypothetical protein
MSNDAFCKLKRSPSKQQTNLLFDQQSQYPNLPSPILDNSLPSSSSSSHQGIAGSGGGNSFKATSISGSVHSSSIGGHNIEKRGATDLYQSSSPSKKSKLSNLSANSSSTSFSSSSTLSSSFASAHHQSGSGSGGGSSTSSTLNSCRFNIHDKLRELYVELLSEDNIDANRVSKKNY